CGAYRWTEKTGLRELGDLPGQQCAGAFAVSNDGAIIGGFAQVTNTTGASEIHAFVWTERTGTRRLQDILGTSTGLDLGGRTLTNINSISVDDFSIALVGTGSTSDGRTEAWLAVLPPVQPVVIDIKPGSLLNTINPASHGKIPVAILSTPQFSAPNRIDL